MCRGRQQHPQRHAVVVEDAPTCLPARWLFFTSTLCSVRVILACSSAEDGIQFVGVNDIVEKAALHDGLLARTQNRGSDEFHVSWQALACVLHVLSK